MTQCTSCSKELVPNSKFCKFCGASQVIKAQTVAETSVAKSVCSKCGNQLIPNAKFCKHCGSNVEFTSASNNTPQPTSTNALNNHQSQQESPVVNAPKPVTQSEIPSVNPTTPSNTAKYSVIAIFLTLLIGGVGYWGWTNKKVAEEQSTLIAKQQAEAEAQKIAAEAEKNERTKLELLGVDLKLAIEKIIPDESETNAVPDPITVTKAFKPCKFEGGDGKFQTDCKLSTSGNLLVEENVKDDRNVRIRTIGARTTVDMISFEATFPNNIQNAFSEIADWNIKEIDCGQEKDLERLTIYTAKPNGKREFVFKTTVSYGSGGNWGNLTIHLTPIKDNKPCSLVELNTVNQEPVTSNGNAIEFVTTQNSKPLFIDATFFDTPVANEFLATGKNAYIGNAEAIAKGKKIFQMYSCTQCHGPEAKGQVAPSLIGPSFKYSKDATDKGMFETIWHGTNGGMGAKGIGLMDPTDPQNGITPDEILKMIAWLRSMNNI